VVSVKSDVYTATDRYSPSQSEANNERKHLCETATGCQGAGDFRKWAKQQGYLFCEVWDWTSSAGDWSFIVSKDRKTWYPMFQENAYPAGRGFNRTIDESQPMDGTPEEVFEFLTAIA